MVDAKRATAILKQLGARDAAARGKEHARFPVLERYLLLTGMWRAVLPDDATWKAGDDAVGKSIGAVLEAGVAHADLTRIVRQAQVDLLFEICQLLDRSDHGIEDLQGKIAENVEWRVCEYDGVNETVGRPMQDLHASVMQYDPTGREGRPSEPARRARRRRR